MITSALYTSGIRYVLILSLTLLSFSGDVEPS